MLGFRVAVLVSPRFGNCGREIGALLYLSGISGRLCVQPVLIHFEATGESNIKVPHCRSQLALNRPSPRSSPQSQILKVFQRRRPYLHEISAQRRRRLQDPYLQFPAVANANVMAICGNHMPYRPRNPRPRMILSCEEVPQPILGRVA